MYFSRFPFQDRPVSLKDETVALYAVYALLRFLTIGAGDGTHERMVDIAAALFRLVDHTDFDRYAVPILKQICSEGSVIKLLMLQLGFDRAANHSVRDEFSEMTGVVAKREGKQALLRRDWEAVKDGINVKFYKTVDE